ATAFLGVLDAAHTTFTVGVIGTALAAAVLSKQDFWLPAAYMLAAAFFCIEPVKKLRGLLLIAFALPVALATIVIALTAGWSVIPQVVTGYGQAQVAVGRTYPSGSRLTLELIAMTGIASVVSLACIRSWKAFGASVVSCLIGIAIYCRFAGTYPSSGL